MSARIDITPRAEQQAYQARDWWRQNRAAAPRAFEDELADAFRLLAEQPEVGQRLPRPRFLQLRRLLMRKTRYHVFYEYQAATNSILVLAIWSAVRGRPPRLSRR